MSEAQLPREVKRRLAIIRHVDEVTGNDRSTPRGAGWPNPARPRMPFGRSGGPGEPEALQRARGAK
jgi:hypothetical protein